MSTLLFPASLVLALSLVSMEVFAPHKMAEIRASTWQQGGPRPKNGMPWRLLNADWWCVGRGGGVGGGGG